MSNMQLFNQLQNYQALVLNLCLQDKAGYCEQYHPDLSPTGWHLGHCIYTESYWIREMFLRDKPCDDALAKLYNPLLSGKPERGAALPEHDELCAWAKKNQTENITLLKNHQDHYDPLNLMQNDFLLYFLIQHYAQHYETMQMSCAQAVLHSGKYIPADRPLQSSMLDRTAVKVPANTYHIGANGHRLPYDNEYPRHSIDMNEFHIGIKPVTNSEYLKFIEQDGYGQRKYWTDSGWKWCKENKITGPEYWRRDDAGRWYGINHQDTTKLVATSPVYGICRHEAEAFANWAGARLPHEQEWETAYCAGVLENTGIVWEWCSNAFYPYSGFEAYPYDGYSLPYFDGMHYTLKGGSLLTQPVIKRASFRNYYQAEKRFLFAGLRLVFDQ